MRRKFTLKMAPRLATQLLQRFQVQLQGWHVMVFCRECNLACVNDTAPPPGDPSYEVTSRCARCQWALHLEIRDGGERSELAVSAHWHAISHKGKVVVNHQMATGSQLAHRFKARPGLDPSKRYGG